MTSGDDVRWKSYEKHWALWILKRKTNRQTNKTITLDVALAWCHDKKTEATSI